MVVLEEFPAGTKEMPVLNHPFVLIGFFKVSLCGVRTGSRRQEGRQGGPVRR